MDGRATMGDSATTPNRYALPSGYPDSDSGRLSERIAGKVGMVTR